MSLEDAPKGYKMFHDNQDEVTKVVLKPGFTETAVAAE
jgi:threonine dehydrogenase-like Zn-dependent dehydrogenase